MTIVIFKWFKIAFRSIIDRSDKIKDLRRRDRGELNIARKFRQQAINWSRNNKRPMLGAFFVNMQIKSLFVYVTRWRGTAVSSTMIKMISTLVCAVFL